MTVHSVASRKTFTDSDTGVLTPSSEGSVLNDVTMGYTTDSEDGGVALYGEEEVEKKEKEELSESEDDILSDDEAITEDIAWAKVLLRRYLPEEDINGSGLALFQGGLYSHLFEKSDSKFHPSNAGEVRRCDALDIYQLFMATLAQPGFPKTRGKRLAEIVVEWYGYAGQRGVNDLWHIFLTHAYEIPKRHAEAEAMFECLALLMWDSDFPWWTDHSFWLQMNECLTRMPRSDGDTDDMAILRQQTNFNSFTVRVQRAEHEAWAAKHHHLFHAPIDGYHMLGRVLRITTGSPDMRYLTTWQTDMWMAADWFIEWAAGVYEFMLQSAHAFINLPGPASMSVARLWNDRRVYPRSRSRDQIGDSVELWGRLRWETWKWDLARLSANERWVSPALARHLLNAVLRMDEVDTETPGRQLIGSRGGCECNDGALPRDVEKVRVSFRVALHGAIERLERDDAEEEL